MSTLSPAVVISSLNFYSRDLGSNQLWQVFCLRFEKASCAQLTIIVSFTGNGDRTWQI